jgi:UDP-3-O-[3-hydroxymyristoyl] glucosamine N-acyltransferase
MKISGALSITDCVHVGSGLSCRGTKTSFSSHFSITEYAVLSSAISSRSFGRAGSSLSIFGVGKFLCSASILSETHFGSTLSIRNASRVRLGENVSLLGCAFFGSGVSLRSFSRLSSNVSCNGFCYLGDKGIIRISLISNVQLGSSLSLRSHTALGLSMSLLEENLIGSCFSIRKLGRIGSGISLVGRMITNGNVSVYNQAFIGSSVSVRACRTARLAGPSSILMYGFVGSSLSCRSITQIGSACSCLGIVRFGSLYSLSVGSCVQFASDCSLTEHIEQGGRLSVFSELYLGSTMSLRSLGRFTGKITTLDSIHLGSSISVRGLGRMGSVLSLSGTLAYQSHFSVS